MAKALPRLEMVENFPAEVVDAAWKEIPRTWFDGDEDALEAMLERLLKRRSQTPGLVNEMRQTRTATFPNWR